MTAAHVVAPAPPSREPRPMADAEQIVADAFAAFEEKDLRGLQTWNDYGRVAVSALQAAGLLNTGWREMNSAPRPDLLHPTPIMVQRSGYRYIAQWDADAGHFQGLVALDAVEPGCEWPGRLYGLTHWQPLPAPPPVPA